MKTIYRKAVFLFSAVLAVALAAGAVYFGKDVLPARQSEEIRAVFSTAHSGSISPVVLDAKTQAPISGATICIPETGKNYETDESGTAGTISIPILRDTRYDEMLPKDWGEITLLVYKEGYAPYALFYLRVREKEARIGPTIYLYTTESFGLETPFSIIENPEDAWAAELIKKYRPNGQ
ncbi:hypothetical protein AALG83_02860 [Christensenellaceae bacterium 44-20]